MKLAELKSIVGRQLIVYQDSRSSDDENCAWNYSWFLEQLNKLEEGEMESQELTVQQKRPLTADQIKAQVQLIQQVMAAVMEKDVHYGTIPGTQKPTLYKPGSEKILATFHIAAYPKEVEDLSTPDEIRYRVKVHGLLEGEGLVGVGIGECSSSEEKYKWRKPVCDEEFNETAADRKRIAWKRGEGGKTYQQKQIRTNPSDVANTILKMAKKRAQIDMTLTATAASDVFDQDLDDLPEGMVEGMTSGKPPIKEPQKKQNGEKPAEKIGDNSTQILIKEVTIQEKTKEGKPMKSPLYWIKSADGSLYKTFDKKFYDMGKPEIDTGLVFAITFNKTQYGNDLVTMGPAEQPKEDEPGAQG